MFGVNINSAVSDKVQVGKFKGRFCFNVIRYCVPEFPAPEFHTSLRINSRAYESIKNQHPIYKNEERLKKKVGIFQGLTKKDIEFLK